MKTSQEIIDIIREDCPCVYDILVECYHHPYSITDGATSPKDPPTPDQLLDHLMNYDGDNYDAHYWQGRYFQMKQDNESQREPIRVPFTEADINELQEGTHFHWTYGGVPLFIFNTDSTPQLDPDSPEYDPSITV